MIKSEKQRIWLEKLHKSRIGKPAWNKNKKTGLVPRTAFKKGQTSWNKGIKNTWSTPPVRRGKDNNKWKGGITPLNNKIRNSLEYKLWRKAVFERDNYICQFCRVRGTYLEADHIKPFAYFPKLRFVVDNGRTLCLTCHRTTFTYLKEYKK